MGTYVYLDNKHDAGVFTVGFYTPEGGFVPESDHETVEQAAERVAHLNGGGGSAAVETKKHGIKDSWGHPVFGALLRVAQQVTLANPVVVIYTPHGTMYYCVLCGAEVGHEKHIEKHRTDCPWVALCVAMRQWQREV